VRTWDAEHGWQPPLRTPAPVPIPDGVTPEQLVALGELGEPGESGRLDEV
ncbi:acyltransferase, partial [Streptomyces sp. SID10116]|nr:acyltransferase [Streptomyces sp. SID10116]